MDNSKNEGIDQKKKQKAGLNAVRPDDYIENKFKEMAKDMNLSQTEMFSRIFWSYINEQRSERKESALSLESEIDLISKDLGSILNHFKTIAEKAQNTIISVKTNAEQNEKNLNLDKDTLAKKVEELSKRNEELEKLNSAFDEVKSGLENKMQELRESLMDKENKLKEAGELNKTKEKETLELVNSNKNFEKQINSLESANARLEKEIIRMRDEVTSKESAIRGLEQSNTSLSNTINTLDKIKEAEIDSIESKYQLKISELEIKINSIKEDREKELNQLENNLKTEYEADKKMSIADMKLELADIKSKYAEALTQLNAVKVSKGKKTESKN